MKEKYKIVGQDLYAPKSIDWMKIVLFSMPIGSCLVFVFFLFIYPFL